MTSKVLLIGKGVPEGLGAFVEHPKTNETVAKTSNVFFHQTAFLNKKCLPDKIRQASK
ncbi:hypothetical protein l11_02470 [Neisseria weaveri LMG 5135]|nr:hypothetical protein l11_02470 [Neisseria weaveri LMG 5135]